MNTLALLEVAVGRSREEMNALALIERGEHATAAALITAMAAGGRASTWASAPVAASPPPGELSPRARPALPPPLPDAASCRSGSSCRWISRMMWYISVRFGTPRLS